MASILVLRVHYHAQETLKSFGCPASKVLFYSPVSDSLLSKHLFITFLYVNTHIFSGQYILMPVSVPNFDLYIHTVYLQNEDLTISLLCR